MTGRAQIGCSQGNCLKVTGEMVFDTVPDLLQQGRRFLCAGEAIVVDLEGVTQVDSAGLALMLEWMGICQAGGQDIHFRQVPDALMSIARLSNTQDFLPLVAD